MFLTRRIVASTTGATAISFRFGSYDVRARPPPPLAGMQPSSGRKLASERVVRATKTAERVVVTPGPTGPPSVPRNESSSGPARSASRPPMIWPRPGQESW